MNNFDKEQFLVKHVNINKLTHLHYCIQCIDSETGNQGCFAYDFDHYSETKKFRAISPNFGHVGAFYKWAHGQGFVLHDESIGPFVMRRKG